MAGSIDEGCEPPLGTPPPRPRDCAPGTEWIYLIGIADSADETPLRHLLEYHPDTGEMRVVGEPDCGAGFSPFSMAVDREGNAWVLSARGTDDGLYRLSTADASCERTPYVPDVGGYEEFGMGFAADARDATTERLYVVGGPRSVIHRPGAENLFGVLDLGTFTIETRARIVGRAELTGTGDGNLWAFFGGEDAGRITRLDPVSGASSTSYDAATGAGAFAFAFWGGDFYVFVTPRFGVEAQIYRVRTLSGSVREIGTVTGYVVPGAAVSTCAPYELI